MKATSPLSILLLADDAKGNPNTIHEHIQSFRRYSRHAVDIFNPRGITRSRWLDLRRYDVVVIHYSLAVVWDDYLSPTFRELIGDYDGLKVQFVQDEYRFVDELTQVVRTMGIDVLYSVAPAAAIAPLYAESLPDTEILPTLTGYVPRQLVGIDTPPLEGRLVDVGYRGRSLPYWVGRLGFEKIEIGRGFLGHAGGVGLRCDIAWTEGARIHGEAWNRFVLSCKTMLASESGASIVDFNGAIERSVREYLASRPAADYEEVEERVLSRFDHGPTINTASPRIFEAAALRTGMVMFPGEYSGIVEPWTHYIPLQKDFSNVEEVAEHIRDGKFLRELTDRSHADLIASGRYAEEAFVRRFDEEMAERTEPAGRAGRHARALLRLEETASGRGYHISTLYGVARRILLAAIGIRETLRSPAIVRAARHIHEADGANRKGKWNDLFRLALLRSFNTGDVVPAGEPFFVVVALDETEGRLTFTSLPKGAAADAVLPATVRQALLRGAIREIIWNHASFDQYVALPLPFTRKRIAFDVGRYDSYGVYRFDQLARIAATSPSIVADALEPLLKSTLAAQHQKEGT